MIRNIDQIFKKNKRILKNWKGCETLIKYSSSHLLVPISCCNMQWGWFLGRKRIENVGQFVTLVKRVTLVKLVTLLKLITLVKLVTFVKLVTLVALLKLNLLVLTIQVDVLKFHQEVNHLWKQGSSNRDWFICRISVLWYKAFKDFKSSSQISLFSWQIVTDDEEIMIFEV